LKSSANLIGWGICRNLLFARKEGAKNDYNNSLANIHILNINKKSEYKEY